MAEGKNSLKIKDINEALEIEMGPPSGAQPLLAQSFARDFTNLAAQLLDFSRAMGYPVDSTIQTANTRERSTGK